MIAPLPTLRRPSKEQRLAEILDDAIVHMTSGRHSSATADLLVAIEVAYGGLGKMPPALIEKLDKLNLIREAGF